MGASFTRSKVLALIVGGALTLALVRFPAPAHSAQLRSAPVAKVRDAGRVVDAAVTKATDDGGAPQLLPDQVITAEGCSRYEFGGSLAAGKNELLVGAPWRDYAVKQDAVVPPSACLYRRSGKEWSLAQVLKASNSRLSEGFARAVALSGDGALVSAPGHENGDGPTVAFSKSTDGGLAVRDELDAPERTRPDEEVFAEYGAALAMDDRFVVIGASLAEPMVGGRRCNGCGAVYVFDRSSRTKTPIATIAGATLDALGYAVALSGEWLVAGAPKANPAWHGRVRVYHRDAPDRWREVCHVEGSHHEFGESVAASGSRFAVNGGTQPMAREGRVSLFEVKGEACVPLATFSAERGFGASLAFEGDRLAVGSTGTFAAQDGGSRPGRVGLFRVAPSGALLLEAWLVQPPAKPFARFGGSVALGSDFVAAGNADGVPYVAVKSWVPPRGLEPR